MKRQYFKWRSQSLDRMMELLVFGDSGARVIVFPTRVGRFFDYEDWGILNALRGPIENGLLQVYCLDSIDAESFYCFWAHPSGRINRHKQYDAYVTEEVIPFSESLNDNPNLISHGCSFGAYHAVNIAVRHPKLFCKIVALSGRYDLTENLGEFPDLLDTYYDEDVYYHMPLHFVPNLECSESLEKLSKMEITLAVGNQDPFLDSNRRLSEVLSQKGIHNDLHIWEGRAHKARYWRQMVPHYL